MMWGDFILGFIAGFIAYGIILMIGEIHYEHRKRKYLARLYWPKDKKPDIEPGEIDRVGIQKNLEKQRN